VNGIDQDQELSFEGSSSDDSDNSEMMGADEAVKTHSKTVVGMYVQTELKAVMRIK
jgi:hypothetical protein